MAPSPVGRITRGTTGTNRLRRVDRWIARHPALRRADDPLVVDLGFGASGVTALELEARLRRTRSGCRGARARDRPRARRVAPAQLGGRARGRTRSPPIPRVVRARRLRGPVACRAPAGRDPRDERAAPVRRGGGRAMRGGGWPRDSHPAACSSRARATRSAASRPGSRSGRTRSRDAHALAAPGGAGAAVDRRRTAAQGPHPPQRAGRARPRASRRSTGSGIAQRASRPSARCSGGAGCAGGAVAPSGRCTTVALAAGRAHRAVVGRRARLRPRGPAQIRGTGGARIDGLIPSRSAGRRRGGAGRDEVLVAEGAVAQHGAGIEARGDGCATPRAPAARARCRSALCATSSAPRISSRQDVGGHGPRLASSQR